MSDTTIIPPVEGPQEEAQQDETSPFIHLSFPKATTIVISVLIVLLAAVTGLAVAGTFLLGSAHGATGHAQAQYGASQSQLHSTQGTLSSTRGQLSASQATLTGLQGASLVGVWYGSSIANGWSGTLTINADHSFAFSPFVGGAFTGTWSIVSPGTLLIVGTNNYGAMVEGGIWTYTVNGNTLTYTSSDGSSATMTK